MRKSYRAKHPTPIAVWECMDGRTRMELVSGMPAGILQSWENGGGVFHLDWLLFQSSFMDWYRQERERLPSWPCAVTRMWHFSASREHLGCKAHNYDAEVAEATARAQVADLWEHFREENGGRYLYPFLCALETDSEGLIFQKREGPERFDLSLMIDLPERNLRERLYAFYPEAPRHMLDDLLPIVTGNIRHIQNVRGLGRSTDACDHCESVIAVGRGLEWLGKEAFVIGPFDPRFPDMVETAARVVLENFKKGTIDRRRGAALLASTPFRPFLGRPGRQMAGLKASSLMDTAHSVIVNRVPELLPHLRACVVGTVSNDTRRFTPFLPIRRS